ncbi:MAG TPA: hypothetical protein VHW09_32400 [Bryobacteraceae bacterium]|jgi:uncharacterized protein (TIGR03437 family)|nr:hypothetical protein [Bryobacteraceae bacterium]
MDAAQINLKKIAFFFTTALLLTAPIRAFALPTLNVTGTTVTIGSSTCNDSANLTVTSSDGTDQAFTVAVQYSNGNQFGNWLFADLTYGGGATSTGTPFSATTSTSGISLTIGLNYGLAANTATASVVLTPTSNPGSPTYITVYYSQNSSCGGNTGTASNGFISVSPGNISLAAPTNGQQSQAVTVQNIGGGSYAFAVSVSPSNTWLAASSNSVALNPGGTTSVSVTGTGSKTAGVGTYTGSLVITPASGYAGTTINIPVTFTVGNGTSGGGTGSTGTTLTINGATSNTYTTSFDYIAPNAPGPQCIPIQDTAQGASGYTATVTTANGGNWLLANNQQSVFTPQLLDPSDNACVNLSLNPAVAYGLSPGAYQGSVALSSTSGASATLSVNYYVSAGAGPGVTVTAQGQSSSGLIYVFPNVASNSTVVQQQTFTISGTTGVSLSTATLSGGATGFSMTTPTASNNTETFTVTSNSTGLVTGVYTSTITTASTYNNQTSTTSITIIQPVGQSGTTYTGGGGSGTGTAVVAPTSISFQQQAGSSFWTGGKEAQAITLVGPQGTAWSANIVYGSGSGWLIFDSSNSGTFGNGPATLLLDLSNGITGLAASSTPYQATVNITVGSQTITLSVSLLVTSSNQPVLLGIPPVSTFNATTGNTISSQSVTIVGSDNTGSLTSPPITAGTPTATWVTASTGGNTLTMSINLTGLSTGVYTASILVTANAYNNAINYPVVVVVNGGGGGTGGGNSGPLTLSTTALSYPSITTSTSQNLGVTASSTTQFTLSASQTSCTNSNWLVVTSGGYTASSTTTQIPVTVNPSGIANGTTCAGVLTLTSPGGAQMVNVSMTVGTSSGSGNVTLSSTSLSFPYTQGQSVPAAQTVTIVNAASGTASIPFTVAVSETNGTSVTWLQTNVTTAQTPYNSPGLTVSVTPGNLPPATYTGTVTITPTGGAAQTIGVTMTVTGTATVTATPTSVSWTYIVGSTAPTATIQVSAAGATAAFTAAATSTGGWLQVTPTSGNTPNTGTFNLNVSTVASALAALLPSATPYTGTITVQGTSPATGTTIINVSLTITAPLPVITGITNAASGATGSVAPGEIISIYGTPANPIGPANSVQLDSTTCPNPCTLVPTTMGGVQVVFLPGNEIAPLLFVNQGQINAVVPYTVAGIAALSVEVKYLGQSSNAFPVSLASAIPGLFTANSSGTGQIAADQYDLQGNESQNLPSAPAKAGWTLVLYMTGEGSVSPQPANGAVTVYNANSNPAVPVPLVAPTVLIGNQPATVSFYGEAPGLVSGVLQINVVVPAGAGTGAVSISVAMGNKASQAGATVSLQ